LTVLVSYLTSVSKGQTQQQYTFVKKTTIDTFDNYFDFMKGFYNFISTKNY